MLLVRFDDGDRIAILHRINGGGNVLVGKIVHKREISRESELSVTLIPTATGSGAGQDDHLVVPDRLNERLGDLVPEKGVEAGPEGRSKGDEFSHRRFMCAFDGSADRVDRNQGTSGELIPRETASLHQGGQTRGELPQRRCIQTRDPSRAFGEVISGNSPFTTPKNGPLISPTCRNVGSPGHVLQPASIHGCSSTARFIARLVVRQDR